MCFDHRCQSLHGTRVFHSYAYAYALHVYNRVLCSVSPVSFPTFSKPLIASFMSSLLSMYQGQVTIWAHLPETSFIIGVLLPSTFLADCILKTTWGCPWTSQPTTFHSPVERPSQNLPPTRVGLDPEPLVATSPSQVIPDD